MPVSRGIERVFAYVGTCIRTRIRIRTGARLGWRFPVEYELIMTPQSPLKLGGGGGLLPLRLLEPSGPLRVRSSPAIRGNLLRERGNGGLKSIQSQTEFAGEDRFDFLSQTGLCGERFLLIEIHLCEPQNLVLYSTANHDYHCFFGGLLAVLTAMGSLLKQHGSRRQE